MIEIEGPATSSYTGPGNEQKTYVVYAIGADTVKECLDAYHNWYTNVSAYGRYIVWRRKPTLTSTDEGTWQISWRCFIEYYPDFQLNVEVKPEGEPIQKLC